MENKSMYADSGLIEWLLFQQKESIVSIAKNVGVGETSVSDLKHKRSDISGMRFNNAAAMTAYAEKKLYGESDTEKKIQWLLDQYAVAGIELSKHELIKKMTDSYYELAKGHFISELNK